MTKYLITLILALASAAAQAGIDEVIQAEQAIEAAKEAKKAAIKRLTPVERAELRVMLAQRALEKARNAPAKRVAALCSTDTDCALLAGDPE